MDRMLIDRLLAEYEGLGKTIKEIDTLWPAEGENIIIKPEDNLQAALDNMQANGGILTLSAGDYNIVPKLNFRNKLIAIRGDGPVSMRGFSAANRSGNISFDNVKFDKPKTTNHIVLGGDRTTMKTKEDVPSGFTFTNCIFNGPTRRGILANCKDLLIDNCSLINYFTEGQDSQAIGGSNGSENHIIRNSVLEAASENIMYGGADAASEDMFPRDILLENCKLTKKKEWKDKFYNMKCLIETKNVINFTARKNILSGCWKQSWGNAPAIVIKSANQDGTNPNARSENILIELNVVDDVGSYIIIVGNDKPTIDPGRTNNVRILNNLFKSQNGEPDGRELRLADGTVNILVDHNTFLGAYHSFIEMWGVPHKGFRYTNNIAQHGIYGVRPNNMLEIEALLNNAILKTPGENIKLPATNVYYTDLLPTTLKNHLTSDGRPVGANF